MLFIVLCFPKLVYKMFPRVTAIKQTIDFCLRTLHYLPILTLKFYALVLSLQGGKQQKIKETFSFPIYIDHCSNCGLLYFLSLVFVVENGRAKIYNLPGVWNPYSV